MPDLQSFNLHAILLLIASRWCYAHDQFHGYHYGPPKPQAASFSTHNGYNQRNGYEVKLSFSLPMLNYFNPNVVESIVNIQSEYQPVPMILTKQYVNGNHINKGKILDSQNKELTTKASKNAFIENKDNNNKQSSNETEDINSETTTEATKGTTDYDDVSTTTDYLEDRLGPEVVASLLG